MHVVEVPEPAAPAPGEVLVRPEAVGLCGSDFHYYLGDIGGLDDADRYPRVQGHEVCAVVEAAGPGCPEALTPGTRVALWPVGACGECYACRIGRGNACERIRLIGIHRDGALQERLLVPAGQVFPLREDEPAVGALVEPVSIAVRAVVRGRVADGERVVVFGAGPIGQAVALAASDRGASVLLVDRVESRLERCGIAGTETLAADDRDEVAAGVREWTGGEAPEVVVEATGVPELVQDACDLVAQAGRVLVVGLSARPAPLVVGNLAFRELDLLGVSCCGADEFAAAADLVARRRDEARTLVTHEFPLERAAEAIEFAIANPGEVTKAVIRLDGR